MRVSLDHLNPVEYGAMEAWAYDEIAHCQDEFRHAQKQFPNNWNAPRARVAPAEGKAGPQF